jgi:hypothetical protein
MPLLAVTDLEGRFRMTGLNPGRWNVIVFERLVEQTPMKLYRTFTQDLSFWVEVSTFVRAGETTRVEIPIDGARTEEMGSISGRVMLDGRAPEGAWVAIHAGYRELSASVGSAGGYRLDGVPTGEWMIRVTIPQGVNGEPGFEMSRNVSVEAGLTNLEDFMIETGTIIGRLVRSPEEVPVAGALVEIWGACNMPGLVAMLIEEKDEGAGPSSVSDHGYGFSDPVRMNRITGSDGSFRFDRLPAGSYNMRWSPPADSGPASGTDILLKGGESAVAAVDVIPGATVGPVVLTIYPPVVASGIVKLPDDLGAGVRYLLVAPEEEVAPHWETIFIVNDGQIRIGSTRMVRIDQETGAFEIRSITPGAYTANLYDASNEPVKKRRFKAMPFHVPPGGVTGLVLVPEEKETGKDE